MPSAVDFSAPAAAPHEALPSYLTLSEACEVLRVSKPTLVGAIRRGEMEGRQVGRQWRIPREAFRTASNKQDSTTPAEGGWS